jgi:hypothetical protein
MRHAAPKEAPMSKYLFALLPILFTLSACSDLSTSPADRRFNISFKYGIGGRNELDTFHNEFTKDLLLDGTITVPFVLSDAELRSIESKLVQMGFFDYPDVIRPLPSDTIVSFDPSALYAFEVRRDDFTKNLVWDTGLTALHPSEPVRKLQDAITFITIIIESKPEYQRLPAPRGNYL